MKRVRAVGVALALVTAVFGGMPRAGAASTDVETGWWTSSPAASAPDGGGTVATGPHGPVSVSALRLDLGSGVTAARVVLPDGGGVLSEFASIEACRGDEAWTPGPGGPLEEAPEARCGRRTHLVERDGDEWTIDVLPLVRGATGRVTVVLVPSDAEPAAGGGAPGWEMRFEAPRLIATPVPSTPPPTSPRPATTTTTMATTSTTMTVALPSPPPAVLGATTSRSTGDVPARTGRFSAPPSPDVTLTSGGDDDPGAVVVSESAAPSPLPRAGGGGGTPWGRGVALVLIAGVAGAAAGLGRHLLAPR